jgi:hypothetical protein
VGNGRTQDTIKDLFLQRLQTAHQGTNSSPEIDETKSLYSSFVSEHFPEQYTELLKAASIIVAKTKKDSKKRDIFESDLVMEFDAGGTRAFVASLLALYQL